ncbi:orotidine-5'-phosphate decarboxylase [Acidithiobacillus acidisediminis]|uniref:orotidine-5'-phosphate decarboxylase n=1 Tax=Acidithiobacillus acidisediminis TaxID=2937799 RepID=UPI00200D668B|nr:orotidine-5'-phosphate decarboxylase [Acidithiobacillus sp. S30A2]
MTPLIVALDFPRAELALAMAARLDPQQCRLKVGKELFTSAGPALVEALQKRGFQVFLDLKFHDIPATVAGACRAAASLGVWMLNVHASGGRAMLEAARAAVDQSPGPKPLLIAVTVLTSLASQDLREIGCNADPAAQVMRLASLAAEAGLDGVVCSAQEAGALRQKWPDLLRITPGIRPAGASLDDQRRVLTPTAALAEGADYLVVGRPVTAAPDPATALAGLIAEIESVHPY